MEVIFQYSSNYFFAYIYILKIAFMHSFPKAKCQNIEDKRLLVSKMSARNYCHCITQGEHPYNIS